AFLKLCWQCLLAKLQKQPLVIFNVEALFAAKLIRHDKILYFETENPYRNAHSKKTILLARLIKILSKSFVLRKSIIVCPDPYRLKLNRRFYGFKLSAVLPPIRLNLDYPTPHQADGNVRTKTKKIRVGYLGRITTTTASDVLMNLDRLDQIEVACVGRIYSDHVSAEFLNSPLAKKIRFIKDFSLALDIMAKCEICIAITIENRSDVGTKYQTPTKIWDYIQLKRRFIATDSPSIRYYLGNFGGVAWVKRKPQFQEIIHEIYSLADRHVDPEEFDEVLKRVIDVYENNMSNICEWFDKMD
ncbi:hypothetical protein N9L23_06775, partial [Alphaproteobacteria bacterium]|nr:hypothetical protein [Alphaproteobacteria bacterium]